MSAWPSLVGTSWRRADLDRGLPALARAAGLPRLDRAEPIAPAPGVAAPGEGRFGSWLALSAGWLGLETEAITVRYGELPQIAETGGPAVLHLNDDAYLLLVGRRRGRIRVLAPSGSVVPVARDELITLLRSPLDADARPNVEALLDSIGVPARRRAKAADALLDETLAERPIALGWLLRAGPHAPFAGVLRRAGAPGRFAALLGVHAAQYVLFLLSWWLLGRAALGGTLAPGWMAAWCLLLVTLVPLRMATAWWTGDLSIRVGTRLKQRLLHGALSSDADTVRREGAGGALGRVLESEAVEALVLGGGLAAVTALLELPFAAWVLAQGAAPWLHVGLFLVFVLGLVAWAGRLYRAVARWTDGRLSITHELVEKMIGHQTRLAQEPRARRHEGEGTRLESYLDEMERLDHRVVDLMVVPRAWLALALLALVPTLSASASASTASLAVSVGGLLLAYASLGSLTGGLSSLATAAVSWRRVAPLFRAGRRASDVGLPSLGAVLAARRPSEEEVDRKDDSAALVRAAGVAFRYPSRDRPVLEDVDLEISPGDRILVEGPSGGGKSTLASVLVGLREPTRGLVTLYGMDRGSVGQVAWRRRLVMVPQFHENHVLTETFAFNLLLGRGWPPRPMDLREAETICRELGLGDLLARMPSGLMQMVGDTGWQLSHGEKSRLFLARALLQDADLVILDESFAALDPENLERAMACALRRGRTIVVIAHP